MGQNDSFCNAAILSDRESRTLIEQTPPDAASQPTDLAARQTFGSTEPANQAVTATELVAPENRRRQRAANAALLTSASFAGANAIRFGNNLVLSYLLAPEIFGLMALANVTIQAVQMFFELGVGTCLIQHPRGEEPEFANTAWTIQMIRGPIISLFTCLLAYPLAVWYEEPQVFPVVLALSIIPIMQCACSTATYIAGRRLELGRLTALELTSQLIGCVLMCFAAWRWASVWALVLGTSATVLIHTVGSHLLFSHTRNRLAWNRDAAKAIFGFGKWITFGTAVTFLAIQIDRLILGKIGTLSELGLYHLAMSVASLTPLAVTRMAAVVQFPLMSEAARERPAKLATILKQTRHPLLIAGLILSLGSVISGPLLFDLLYEERYQQAGWIVQMMFVATWFTVLSKSTDRVFVALGDTRLGAFTMLVGVVACLVGSTIGYLYAGLTGFCLGAGGGAIINQLAIYPALKHHGLKCYREDAIFTAIAGLSFAVVYWVQNSAWIASLGASWAKAPPMFGHWLALTAFCGVTLAYVLFQVRAGTSQLWQRASFATQTTR